MYLEDTLSSRISHWQVCISKFSPFIPGGYPAICAECHRKRNEKQFSASAVHQNALKARSYPWEKIWKSIFCQCCTSERPQSKVLPVGKDMKINFLPVLYIRTPSEQGLTRRKRNENQFSASAVHQNALRARSYPKEHTGRSQGRPLSGRVPHLDGITPL